MKFPKICLADIFACPEHISSLNYSSTIRTQAVAGAREW